MQRRLLVKGKVYENGRVKKIITSLRINPRNLRKNATFIYFNFFRVLNLREL